jgi:hypothetical protein
MLWSQFSAIFDYFRRKIGVFSQKNIVVIKFCMIYLALFWVKNANFFDENILKIL